jgi:hypothetical protein
VVDFVLIETVLRVFHVSLQHEVCQIGLVADHSVESDVVPQKQFEHFSTNLWAIVLSMKQDCGLTPRWLHRRDVAKIGVCKEFLIPGS